MKHYKKSIESIIEEAKKVNASPLFGQLEYFGCMKKHLYKCLLCDNEWSTAPRNIQQGMGCPECGRKNQGGDRKTKEELIKDAEYVHIYSPISFMDYVRIKEKCLYKCYECDYEWYSRPDCIKQGTGCPECGGYTSSNMEEILAMAKKVNVIPLFEYSEYQGTQSKNSYKCLTCDNIWTTRFNQIRSGSHCPICSHKSAGVRKRKSMEEIISDALKVNCFPLFTYDKYLGNHIKYYYKCLKCTYEWLALHGSIDQGHGCPKCSGLLPKTYSALVCDAEYVHSYSPIDFNDFKNMSEKCLYKCYDCYSEWLAQPCSIQQGHGCLKCSIDKFRKTKENLILEAQKVGAYSLNNFADFSVSSKKCLYRCFKQNHEWLARPDSIKRGTGCPYCLNMFVQEKRIKKVISDVLNIPFVKRRLEWNRGPNGKVLELDGCNEQYKIAFECQECRHNFSEALSKNIINYGIKNIQEKYYKFSRRQQEFSRDYFKKINCIKNKWFLFIIKSAVSDQEIEKEIKRFLNRWNRSFIIPIGYSEKEKNLVLTGIDAVL